MTAGDWVVVLEADALPDEGALDELKVRRLLESLPDVRAVALHSRERYALQVEVAAEDEAQALGIAVAYWRAALGKLGVRNTRLIRAEVLTLEEFKQDCERAYPGSVADAEPPHGNRAKADPLADRLLWQVFHDPLTQLPALGLFMNHLEQALMRRPDFWNQPVVVVLKVAGNGAVDERWRGPVGDEVLAVCAQRLRVAIPRHLMAAHIGDDEFAVLVEGPHDAGELAAAALAALAEPVSVGDVQISVSAGAGIATGRQAHEAETLLGEARAAAYAAGETPGGIEVYRAGLAVPAPPRALLGVPHDPLGYLLLLHRAATAANESTSLAHAAGLVVNQVCAHVGWSVGHLYEVGSDGDLLPGQVVHQRPHRFQGLLDFLEQLRLRPGEALAGRVARTGRPAWTTDVRSDERFPWTSVATGCGLNAALAFPVVVGREVVAVLEFFAPHALAPDDTLVEVLECVGRQLGQVVERRRSELKVRATEDRLRDTLALAKLGSWHLDSVSCRFTWSAEMCNILGVPHDSPQTSDAFFGLVHPDDRAMVRSSLGAVCDTGVSGSMEFRILRPDGDLCWVYCRASVSVDETPTIVGVYGTMLDITDLKRIEAALRGRVEDLTTAERLAQLGSWSLDLASGDLEWSDGLYRLWGVERQTFRPTIDAMIAQVHPEDRSLVREAIARAPETDGGGAAFRVVLPSGQERWFQGRTETKLAHDGRKPARVVGTLRDVTIEKMAERERRASERRSTAGSW